MATYKLKKPKVIEAITFNEFLEIGRKTPGNETREFPWYFLFNGCPVTHENDKCYLIPTQDDVLKFTSEDVLIIDEYNKMYPCKIDIFKDLYESVI